MSTTPPSIWETGISSSTTPFMSRHRRSVIAVAIVALALVLVALLAPNADAQTGSFVPARQNTADQSVPPEPETPETSSEAAERQRLLWAALASYQEANPGFDVSVAISDDDTSISYGDATAIETASIVKVEVLVRWLVARQGEALPIEELRLAEDMIRMSDNDATTELCSLIAAETSVGLVPGGVDACVGDGLWGTDQTTASQQIQVLRTATTVGLLSEGDVQVVRRLMNEVAPWQAWGVPAAASFEATTLVKNGWDQRERGWLANSIGIIEEPDSSPMRIAILTRGHADYETGQAHVEAIAALARTALTTPLH